MTEIVARLPRSRGPFRALQALVLAAGLAPVALGIYALRPQPAPVVNAKPRPAVKAEPKPVKVAAPLVTSAVSTGLSDAAAKGLDRGLFTSSPGGIMATAARVARWRPLILRATRHSSFGPNLLEALVFLESAGRADARAGDVAGAVGLTQIVASTGRHFLGMKVNTAKSRRLTTRIERAEWRGSRVQARQLRKWRVRYDQRFAPMRSLRATVRYLTKAKAYLGRDDLAVVSYHMGIGNLQRVIAAYGGETPSYAQLYFGASPDHHAAAWRRLTSLGDMSRDYYWKLLAAKRVMHLYRTDPSALAYEARLQAQKLSSEEVMHPRYRTPRFRTPDAIVRALRHGVLRPIPRAATRTHIAISGFMGAEARKLGRSRRIYRSLRRPTLDVLFYIGRRVHEISGSRQPLILTSAVRDNRYQRVLMRVNANAARTYSIHTTGYAFDIARAYSSSRQAAAFQFVLDRLEAVNAIAYIREAGAIHVAVASDARRKLRLLARAQ